MSTPHEACTYLPERLISRDAGTLDAHALAAALARPIVFVDLETTGANAQNDRITEIGVVEVGPDGISEWDTLVDPRMSIPPFIQNMTGITDDMVRGQPTFESLAEALAERLQGRLFVAHNARFDYGFLKNEFRRAGITFRADVLCTVRLSRALYPSVERHGLDALIARFGLAPKGRHRALADAELLWQFWQRIHDQYSVDLVESAVKSLVKQASLPAGLEETALDDVPDRAGVYLFHGDDDAPLYVGKSIHLRQRIRSHFSGDHTNDNEMRLARAVRRVEWRETGGEVGALLLEAQLVKSLQPLHNRQLRQTRELFSWELPAGLAAPRLRSNRHIDLSRHADLHGVYASKGSAIAHLRALADEHRLCLTTLGIETRTRRGNPCFARQVHRCAGVCVGDELMASHRARLVAALASSALKAWPFAGAIAWREGPAPHPWHVVEDWCYLGSVPQLDAAAGLVMNTGAANPVRFDADTYQILLPHLATLLTEAVAVEATRPFMLTAMQPLLPAPAASETAPRASRRKAQAASVLQQALFA
ncbi:3'-5' exonuclease family protein [Cupriavidus plantarum]|uniref:DNA-directed DNA polymerase n=1 Tax=Cupriavidus plantarum TaxID=942865 RepID=A0A316EKY1_9BURK|nr:exonuclease domain-containing protein [Cupriavidus plantarum]PWK30960.1 DNA polymerase-3 subunit epsilon [Cupriavidus plantarum]